MTVKGHARSSEMSRFDRVLYSIHFLLPFHWSYPWPTYSRISVENRAPYSTPRRSDREILTRSRLVTHFFTTLRLSSLDWNSLPIDIRDCSSEATFKKHLNTFLFHVAFN